MQLKMFIFFVWVLTLSAEGGGQAQGQKKHQFWQRDISHFEYNSVILSPKEVEVIDTVRYAIYYLQTYQYNPEEPDMPQRDNWCLELADRYSNFYSLTMRRNDLRNTVHNTGDQFAGQWLVRLDSMNRHLPSTRPFIGSAFAWEFRADYTTGRLFCTDRIPSPQEGFVFYEESIPEVDWTLDTDQTCTVLTYTCFKATTQFRGRRWIAWFALDLPMGHFCVWKLRGLPGMILKLEDTEGDYMLEATLIRRCNEPMRAFRRKGQMLSFEKWQEVNARFHRDATRYLLPDDTEQLVGKIGQFKVAAEDWVVPYNPIEQE